ncbi:hypothetical protein WN943_019079 [Citrus x changshan-huyou]
MESFTEGIVDRTSGRHRRLESPDTPKPLILVPEQHPLKQWAQSSSWCLSLSLSQSNLTVQPFPNNDHSIAPSQ